MALQISSFKNRKKEYEIIPIIIYNNKIPDRLIPTHQNIIVGIVIHFIIVTEKTSIEEVYLDPI